ncbi:MAG: hypothetical protein ACR2KQ_10015 [Actinomycetota bacterium]
MVLGTANVKVYRIAAVIAAVVVGVAMFGLLAMVGGFTEQPPERAPHSVHDVGWGVMAGLFLTVAWLMQLKDPARKVALLQLQILTAVMLVVVSGVTGELLNPFTLTIVILVAVTAYFHPARDRLTHLGDSFSPVLAGLSLLALVLFAKYGWDQMGLQRDAGPLDEHGEELHYATMALVAFGVPLAGLLVSRRTAGWRQAGWLVGLGLVLLGIVSLMFDSKLGALGDAWAFAALAGGVLFLVAVEIERRGVPATAAPDPAT